MDEMLDVLITFLGHAFKSAVISKEIERCDAIQAVVDPGECLFAIAAADLLSSGHAEGRKTFSKPSPVELSPDLLLDKCSVDKLKSEDAPAPCGSTSTATEQDVAKDALVTYPYKKVARMKTFKSKFCYPLSNTCVIVEAAPKQPKAQAAAASDEEKKGSPRAKRFHNNSNL